MGKCADPNSGRFSLFVPTKSRMLTSLLLKRVKYHRYARSIRYTGLEQGTGGRNEKDKRIFSFDEDENKLIPAPVEMTSKLLVTKLYVLHSYVSYIMRISATYNVLVAA